MTDRGGDTPADGGQAAPDGDEAGQPVVVSIYVLIAMAGEAIFVLWLLTPLFALLTA